MSKKPHNSKKPKVSEMDKILFPPKHECSISIEVPLHVKTENAKKPRKVSLALHTSFDLDTVRFNFVDSDLKTPKKTELEIPYATFHLDKADVKELTKALATAVKLSFIGKEEDTPAFDFFVGYTIASEKMEGAHLTLKGAQVCLDLYGSKKTKKGFKDVVEFTEPTNQEVHDLIVALETVGSVQTLYMFDEFDEGELDDEDEEIDASGESENSEK